MRSRTVALLACLAAFGPVPARGDGPAEAVARPLFDGKSLDGWKATDFFKAGRVAVEDGAIVLAAGEGALTGITSARADLPRVDYELTYEAKRTAGDDFFAAATFPISDSYLTFVNGGWGGSVTGLSCLNGADASENATNHFVKYRNDTWHRFRIRVTAKAIRCRVDDTEVVALDHRDLQLRTRIETRANQPLGFAAWRSSSAIRAIAVRPLTPAEVAATEVVEP